MMSGDDVVREVRAAREEYCRQFGYDLGAIVRDLRERERTGAGRWFACRHAVRRGWTERPPGAPPNPAAGGSVAVSGALDGDGGGFRARRGWIVSQLMEQAIQRARQLPERDQEALASIILQEIEAEERWDELFSRPESADLLARMADEALAEARAGRARTLDIDEL